MRIAQIGAAGAAGAVLTACYFLEPYSDLTAGSHDTDAGAVAVAVAKDASAEASIDASSAPRGFCAAIAPPPTLCADFDDGAPLAAAWTTVNADTGGTLRVDGTVGRSAPASLLAAVPATTSDAPLEYVEREFAVTTELDVAFDARIDALGDTQEYATLIVLMVQEGPAYKKLLYYIKGAGGGDAMMEEELSAPFQGWPSSLPKPVTGVWVHYDLAFDIRDPSAPKLSVSLDGAPALSHQQTGQSWHPGSYSVAFGLSWLNASRVPWAIRYDNIVVNAR